MPALTNDRLTPERNADSAHYPVAANTIIYAGALVALNTSTGYAVPAADAPNLIILGVADARADNSSGSAGNISVVVRFRRAFKFNYTGAINNTHIGRAVYAVDDNTVSLSPGTNRVKVGKIIAVEPDGVWVYIPTPAPAPAVPNNNIDGTWDNTNEGPILAALRDAANNYTI